MATSKTKTAAGGRKARSAPPQSPPPAGEADDSGTKDDERLAASATRLVGQAVSVLERELSAGISAARSLQGRYTDTDALRNRDPDDVMQRFRKDAHEVVDLLMDLVQVAASSASGLAQRAIRVRASSDADQPAGGGIPAIESLGAYPGDTIAVRMALENAGAETVEAVNFLASDLVTASGLRIAASDIAFTPAEVTIGPRSKAQVEIRVKVPSDAEPGVYSGMLVASKLEQVRAVLSVTVEKAPETE